MRCYETIAAIPISRDTFFRERISSSPKQGDPALGTLFHTNTSVRYPILQHIARQLHKNGQVFFILRLGLFCLRWFLLLMVNFLLALDIRFGLFCSRSKIGLVFVSPRLEIGFGLLCLRFPRPEIRFGLFCLRFPHRT